MFKLRAKNGKRDIMDPDCLQDSIEDLSFESRICRGKSDYVIKDRLELLYSKGVEGLSF